MAGYEGELQITLSRRGEAVCDARISSSRPLNACRIFVGKSPAETLATLPLLYSVCGTAQEHAAVAALEQATGLTPAPALTAARQLLVWLETAREHLWRIMIDWPELLREPGSKSKLGVLMNMLPTARQGLFGDKGAGLNAAMPAPDIPAIERLVGVLEAALNAEVFGCEPDEWLSLQRPAAVESWIEHGRTPAARLLRRLLEQGWQDLAVTGVPALPVLDPELLNERFDTAVETGFIATPEWGGEACETTPLARQLDQTLVAALVRERGRGLITRLLATLVELAAIPGLLQRQVERLDRADPAAAKAATGIGLGQVEAARGRLIHRVELKDNLVQRYQILAPTEWNFHPAGVLAQGLVTLRSQQPAELEWLSRLLISAVDPCVGYQLKIT